MHVFRQKVAQLTVLSLITTTLVAVSFSGVSAQEDPTPAPGDVPQPVAGQRTISVTGTGTANGSPDIAFIELGVEIRDANIGAAVEQSNGAMEAVVAALGDFGIPAEDIQTTQFNVWQDQPIDPATGLPTEEFNYVVTNIVRIRVTQIDQISDVIQTALDAGANRVFGLTFGLSDQATLEATAREQAVADARARAEALAAAFGVTLGNPLSITEGFLSDSSPLFSAKAGLGGGGPSISGGQLSVQIQVTVMFEIAP